MKYDYEAARDNVLQIFLSLLCPLLIPFLVTFDTTSEVNPDGKVAPSDNKDTEKEPTQVTAKRYIRNVVGFYNAPVVKFCCHSVLHSYNHINTLLDF